MDQTHTKPVDATQVADKPTANPAATGHNLLDILDCVEKNALAPLANNFVVEPINAGLNVVNGAIDAGTWAVNKTLGKEFRPPESQKLPELEVGPAEPGSMAARSQQIFGTAGSFLVYAAASKLSGGAMRGVGELAPAELAIGEFRAGNAIRALAQDTRVATVAGATAYAGVKDTHDGESHTSNAISTFVGFTFFEAGNSKFVSPGGSIAGRFGQRFLVGTVGGAAQTDVASLIQTGKGTDIGGLTAGSISGGLLNALLPAGRGLIDGAAEHPLIGSRPNVSEAVVRLHAQAARLVPEGKAPEPGSWADPHAIKLVNKAALADLHTKLVDNDALPTRIVHNENVIYAGKNDDPLSVLQELAHARIFKNPEYEQQFLSHAEKLASTDPADPRNHEAKESYIQTRLTQEIEARTSQNAAAEALHAPKRVSVDRDEIRQTEGYGRIFGQEADNFVRSGGKFRPEIDHSAGDNPHEYSATKSGDTTIHTFKNVPIEGLKRNTFTQEQDGTVVGFGFEDNGRIRVEFARGSVHNVNLGEPIKHVRVVDNNDGIYSYYFNKKGGEPQLKVTSENQEMKLLPKSGDKVLITEVDEGGAKLNLAGGSTFTLSGDGKMVVRTPGRAVQIAELGATPSRLAIVERGDGSRLFQLANTDASKQVQLKVEPSLKKPAPPQPVYFKPAPLDDIRDTPRARFREIAPRTPKDLPKEFRTERIQGGSSQSSAGSQAFDSGFSSDLQQESDRYPFQPNLYQDPAHVLTGVDQRSGLDLSDPQQVLVGQMHLYGPLEHVFANLGRHDTDANDGWAW